MRSAVARWGWVAVGILLMSAFAFWISRRPAAILDQRAAPESPTTESFGSQLAARRADLHSRLVGSAACRKCHAQISDAYDSNPMAHATSDVANAAIVERYGDDESFSPDGRHQYVIERSGETVLHHEKLLDSDGGVLYDQAEEINYALGSGHQGRSYLIDREGALFMSPISWYSKTAKWDLSPSYRLPGHPRFSRRVTEACLECHVGQLNSRAGSWNRLGQPPLHEAGIGCERCHGPGRDHIAFHSSTDTSGDDPIVNPAKLAPAHREDVCSQCHLSGEGRILRRGLSASDFQPGRRLEDVYVILVKGTRTNSAGESRAVSQVEQMRVSACFRKSDGRLGCISCHAPHQKVGSQDRVRHYQDACLKCHSDRKCSMPSAERLARQPDDSCVACHMGSLSATDVPHISQTDHRILRSPTAISEESGEASVPEIFDGAGDRLPPEEVQRGIGIWLSEQAERHTDRTLASQALSLLQPLRDASPGDAEVLFALGTASAVAGNFTDSIDQWKAALAVMPEHEAALSSIVVLLLNSRRNREAEPMLDQLLAIQPWNGSMWGRKSLLLGQRGDWNAAREAALRALRFEPSDPRIHLWLAKIEGQLRNVEATRKYQNVGEKIMQQLRDTAPLQQPALVP